ncbi:hypothetical protein K443DRAFT_685549, partial [Laccaria amethystina LaAM-08-1]
PSVLWGRRLIQTRDGDERLLGSAKTVRRMTAEVDERRRLPTEHDVNERDEKVVRQIRVTIVAEVVTRHQLN